MNMRRMQGTVVVWDHQRGIGKVRPDHGGYARVHYRDLPGGHGDLQIGQRVSFVEVKADAGWEAREVEYTDRLSPGATIGDVASARRLERHRIRLAPSCATRDELIARGLLRPKEAQEKSIDPVSIKEAVK